MANVQKYLTHLCQYFPTVLDAYTDITTPNTVTTVTCFAYFGEAERFVDQFPSASLFQQRIGWFVILPNAYHTVNLGDRIDNIVDNQDILVKQEGRVEEKVVYRHHRKGIQFVQVRLNDH